MLNFFLLQYVKILSRSGKTNKEIELGDVDIRQRMMYFIQRFTIRPRTLAFLFETMGSELQEERKHIALYRQQRFQGQWVGDSFHTSHRRMRSSQQKDARRVHIHFWNRYECAVKGKNVANFSQITNMLFLKL